MLELLAVGTLGLTATGVVLAWGANWRRIAERREADLTRLGVQYMSRGKRIVLLEKLIDADRQQRLSALARANAANAARHAAKKSGAATGVASESG